MKALLKALPGFDPFLLGDGLYFDESEADRRIAFIEECCHHVEGKLARAPFVLLDWEKSFAANLFGWKRSDGTRRFREAFLYIPRKNGKTPFAAALMLALFFLDAEAGQQNVIAASDRDQAGKAFRHVAGMIETEPELERRCRIFRGFKSIEKGRSYIKVISKDAPAAHGGNVHVAMIDELHVQRNRHLYDALMTSTASENRRQPLVLTISTADYDRPSICNEMLARARAVCENDGDPAKPGHDPAFLPAVWETTPDDDWTDPEVWERVNPSIDVAVSRSYLKRECRKAQETPAYENTFKRLHLNLVTEQAERWCRLDRWDNCEQLVDVEEGEECILGVDLSSSTDLTSVAAYFPRTHSVLMFYWVPAENVQRRIDGDRVPYDVWQREGLVTFTEGNVIDEDAILRAIDMLASQYQVLEVGLDPWGGRQVSTRLQAHGMEVVAVPQTTGRLNGGMKELERLYLSGELRHGGHQVLRWNAANLAVITDSDGKMKPAKSKSFERIDGISALVNALSRAIARDRDQESVYEQWSDDDEPPEGEADRRRGGSVYETWGDDDGA